MAKMGRPKAEKPIDHIVTVKFREEEYQEIGRASCRERV